MTDAQGHWPIATETARVDGQVGWIVMHVASTPLFVPDPWLTERLTVDDAALRVVAPTAATLVVALVDGLEGTPVAGSFVRLEQSFDGPDSELAPHALVDPLAWLGPTDERGKVEVPGLPCGATLWVSALGEHGSCPVEVRLDTHASPAHVSVRVWRYGSVRGRIADGRGAAFAGAVVLFESPWALVKQANTATLADAHGAFELVDVVAGRGMLRIRPLPEFGWVADELMIDVPGGRVLDLGTLSVPHPGWIEGRLIGADTAGVHHYLTLVRGERANGGGWGVNADGTFRIPAHIGRNLLVVMRDDRSAGDRALLAVAVDVPSPPLEIDLTSRLGSLRATLPAAFPDGVTVTTRLTVAQSESALQGPSDAALAAATRSTTTEGGAFTLVGLPPGEYTLEASLGDLADARREGVRIEPGVCSVLSELSLEPSRLEGRVVDHTGQPVVDARIRCAASELDYWSRSRKERETLSRADGAYAINQLAPRTWTVWAECADGRRSATARVVTQPGATTAFELVVDSPAWIEGVVLRGSRPASADERVTWLYPTIVEGPMKLDSTGPSSPVIPDEAGHFELGPFAPGDYIVTLSGDIALAKPVQLVAGQRTRVTFDISSPDAIFQTTFNSEPFDDIEWVYAFALDPSGPSAGLRVGARRVGRSAFALPALRTKWLLALNARVDGARGTLFAVVEGDSLDGRSVAMPKVSLVVEPDGAGTRPPPRAYLVGLGEWALDPSFADVNQLAYEVREDGLAFHGIPDGARVRLEGTDERGAQHTRELVIRGGGVRVAFP